MTSYSPRQSFSQIIVLESVPHGDAHNGRKIHEDLRSLAVFYSRPFSIRYVDAKNRNEFFDALESVLHDAKFNGHHPILHFECHGSSDQTGMMLADDTYVPWTELKEILTAINVACKCNLLIILSMCHGGHLVAIVDPTERAPCWAMIGPMESTSTQELLTSFATFYRLLFATLSGDLANQGVFNANLNTAYMFTPAEGFFKAAYEGYLRESNTPDNLNSRAKRLAREMRDTPNRVGRGAMKRILKKTEKSAFEKYRRQYFMIDLYPQNEKRFLITYDDVKRLSRQPIKKR